MNIETRKAAVIAAFEAFEAGNVLMTIVADARTTGESVEELEIRLDELRAELEEISNDDSDDDSDENAVDDIVNEVNAVQKKLKAAKALAALQNRGARGRRTDPDRRSQRRAADPVPAQPRNTEDDARHGFGFFGEFASTVLNATKNGGSALERLENVATTYGTESVGGDGGFLVPPEFATQIWQKVRGEGSLMSRTAQFNTGRNSLTFPKDETTPWENSSGIRVFWEQEGDQATASKAKFELETARLHKLMALIKVTEELMDDAIGLDSYLRFWTPVKMETRMNTAIVRGTGAGQPQGILNASSLITVSKEASQDAATVIMPNINKMWNRLYAPLRSNAVWLINQEVEPMLDGMAFVPAAVAPGSAATDSSTPVYLPGGSIAGRGYATLKGAPVVPVQPCSQLGTLGDIILTDLQQYMTLTKGQGIQTDTSMHLHFDQAIETFRFIFRVTGQPLWNSTIAAEQGSQTYGWAIVLEDRS